MYIVIHIYEKKFSGNAYLMSKASYVDLLRHFKSGQCKSLHVVDEAKINDYPIELFVDKKVKQYVATIKKQQLKIIKNE